MRDDGPVVYCVTYVHPFYHLLKAIFHLEFLRFK